MKTTVLVLVLFMFSGCVVDIPQPEVKEISLKNIFNTQKKEIPSYKPKAENWITSALYKEYEKWYQTPYEYGGTCLDGVDCSALIQIIYKDAFNINLPRTTSLQVKRGHKIDRREVKEGDLVFFKTSRNSRHVGIIIEDGKFINASTSRGVTISELSNPYWRAKYWQSRRILPH